MVRGILELPAKDPRDAVVPGLWSMTQNEAAALSLAVGALESPRHTFPDVQLEVFSTLREKFMGISIGDMFYSMSYKDGHLVLTKV